MSGFLETRREEAKAIIDYIMNHLVAHPFPEGKSGTAVQAAGGSNVAVVLLVNNDNDAPIHVGELSKVVSTIASQLILLSAPGGEIEKDETCPDLVGTNITDEIHRIIGKKQEPGVN